MPVVASRDLRDHTADVLRQGQARWSRSLDAAVANADALPVVTQDADVDVLQELGGPAIIRV